MLITFIVFKPLTDILAHYSKERVKMCILSFMYSIKFPVENQVTNCLSRTKDVMGKLNVFMLLISRNLNEFSHIIKLRMHRSNTDVQKHIVTLMELSIMYIRRRGFCMYSAILMNG
jgi:hypothetical protein